MKYLPNINRTDNCWNRFGTECTFGHVFMCLCFLSPLLMQPRTQNIWITKLAITKKKLGTQNTRENKFWNHKISTRTNFGPTKYLREKNFGPTKYPWQHDSTMTLEPRDPRWQMTQNISHTFAENGCMRRLKRNVDYFRWK